MTTMLARMPQMMMSEGNGAGIGMNVMSNQQASPMRAIQRRGINLDMEWATFCKRTIKP
jgi:hypothetical protein